MRHETRRVRHDIVRRQLTVRTVQRLTPRMLRIALEGAELAGFHSAAPDDHIKLILTGADGETQMRDYTPRRFDAAAGVLEIDFAVHEGGPANDWALAAEVGTRVEIAGPRGSLIVPQDFDWWLLVGDETALPAIGRRLEELDAKTPVTVLAAVTGPDEQQDFSTAAALTTHWVHRPAEAAADPAPLLAALEALALPPGDGFVWIAAEAAVARALRTHMLEVRRHPLGWMKASGYWQQGEADAHAKLDA